MHAEDEVVRPQMEAPADGIRLLPDREMGRTAMVVDDALAGALALDVVGHGFEFTDTDHVPIDAVQVFAATEKPRVPTEKAQDTGVTFVLGTEPNRPRAYSSVIIEMTPSW